MFFSQLDWVSGFQREDHGDRILVQSQHLKGIYYEPDISVVSDSL